jgi:transketolase
MKTIPTRPRARPSNVMGCLQKCLRDFAEMLCGNEVLPPSCRKRVSIEAGATPLWCKYVGLDGKTVGIDRLEKEVME